MKKILLAALCALLFSMPVYAAHPGGTAFVDVNGLVCDFCARALEKVFGQQDAVDDIKVDLDTKIITIHFKDGQNLDEETITNLIMDSGYAVEEIRYDE